MKKILSIFTLCISVSILTWAQEGRVLNCKDSTVALYLSNSLKSEIIGDSCVSGIYYIKFSLDNKGNLIQYISSNLMPNDFKVVFKNRLGNLNKNWNKNFLQLVAFKNIIQPIFINVNNRCNLKGNFYINKLDIDSLYTDKQKHIMAKAINESLLRDILSAQKTFINSFNFEDGSNSNISYLDCILLSPCFIVRHIPYKGKRMN